MKIRILFIFTILSLHFGANSHQNNSLNVDLESGKLDMNTSKIDLISKSNRETFYPFEKNERTFDNGFEDESSHEDGAFGSSKAYFAPRFGYDSCVVMSNGIVEVVLDPNFGGRVLSYAVNGINIIRQDKNQDGWTLKKNGLINPVGGRFDIGSEAVAPKRPQLWMGAYKAKIINDHTVTLESPHDTTAGVKVVRIFILDAKSSKLTVTQEVINMSNKLQAYSHWGRTYVEGGGISITPLNPNSRYPMGYCMFRRPNNLIDFKPKDEEGVKVIDHTLMITQAVSDPKFVMDGQDGWLAYISKSNLLFTKKYKVYPDRIYGEITSATASIFYLEDKGVEIEPIGPQEKILPGKSFKFEEEWWLEEFKYPMDKKVDVPMLKGHIKGLK